MPIVRLGERQPKLTLKPTDKVGSSPVGNPRSKLPSGCYPAVLCKATHLQREREGENHKTTESKK